MKKTVFATALLCTVLLSSAAHAATGSTVVPYTQAHVSSITNYNFPDLFITNVSDTDAVVYVTFYKTNGTEANDGADDINAGDIRSDISNVSDWDETLSGPESVSFTLQPGKTQSVRYVPGPSQRGYARIEWTQPGHNTTALLATMRMDQFFVSGERATYIQPVNGGRPF